MTVTDRNIKDNRLSANIFLFEKLTSMPQLLDGWQRVRRNEGACGGDGMTVFVFERTAEARLKKLQAELLNGTYRPGPLRRAWVPKKSGGQRPLDIPTVTDRVVQCALALLLSPVVEPEMSDSSFAYRQRRSVMQAVSRVASHRRDGYEWVVDGDIKRYFENVPHEPLLKILRKYFADELIIDLIELWLEGASPNGKGLPQGSPISPLLANLYLDGIDEAIEQRGVRLVRYADDFVLLCKTEATAAGALEKMSKLLQGYGLTLHPEKTRIVSFNDGFRLLGHLFVRSMVLKEIEVQDDTPPEAALAQAIEPLPDELTDDGPGGRAPLLRVLYVMEPGRSLTIRNESFSVVQHGEEMMALPPHRIDRIDIGQGVLVDVAALDLAAHNGIPVHRIDGWGRTLGQWESPLPSRAKLHLLQASLYLDPARRFALAKRIVEGRIRGQRALLRRLNLDRKDGEIVAACTQITDCLDKLDQEHAIGEVMGQEGRAGAVFWPAFARLIDGDLKFDGRRKRRPPPDPVNAVLSFLYTMLTRDVATLLARRGLHTGFASLHAVDDGDESCAYDLVEEFRAPVAESLAVTLFNRRALQAKMFDVTENICRMNKDARSAIIRGYEAVMNRSITSPASGQKRLWRGLMEDQIDLYARHIEGKAAYKPYDINY